MGYKGTGFPEPLPGVKAWNARSAQERADNIIRVLSAYDTAHRMPIDHMLLSQEPLPMAPPRKADERYDK